MDRIKKYGDKVLRKKAVKVESVDGSVLRIVKKMKAILKEEGGLGLAAPQVGISKRIFIALNSDNDAVITAINPEIISREGMEIDFEGCLSFPEIFFSIERAGKVILRAVNENGEKIIVEAEGLTARCLQHEMDHLDGKLIIDYATDGEKKACKEKLEKLIKK